MSNRIDIVGQAFGQLTILGYAGTTGKSSNWLASCSCGESVYISRKKLLKGRKSCGCLVSKPKHENIFKKVVSLNNPKSKRFVYIASYEGILFKIGCTSNVKERMVGLSKTFPNPITLVCYVEVNGAHILENGLHIKYKRHQIPVMYKHGNDFSREFFRIDLELVVKDLEGLGLEVIYD